MLNYPASIDELLEGDDLDLLGDESGLFDVSDLPARQAPSRPDSVAKRIKCLDFDRFEPLFKAVHEELARGAMQIARFKGLRTITAGRFFVLNGVLLYVAEVGEGGKTPRRQRLRVVFDNGTESSMYRQSLSNRLHEHNGGAVVRAHCAPLRVRRHTHPCGS